MADRIRLTITVTPEVHETFSRMAEASGVSLGRAMGDWLADTMEGAQFVAQRMEQARKAPKLVMREMQSFARGLVEEVDSVAESLRDGSAGVRAARRPGPTGSASGAGQDARSASLPPSSNTGGKSPGKTRTPGGESRSGRRQA